GFLFTRVHTSSFVGPPTQNEKRALRVPLILRSEAREERRRLLHGLAAPRASHLEAASLVTMKVLGMGEAVQLPRRKHRRSLSPEFRHAFALEVLKTERLRIIALIVGATAGGGGLAHPSLFAAGGVGRIFHTRAPVPLLGTSYIVLVLVEASVLVLITRQIKRGGDVPQLRRYIGAFVEPSLRSVVIATHMSNMGAAQALAFVGPLLYFVFIILSTLRLDFWLSVFTGFLAARGRVWRCFFPYSP